MPFYWLWLIWVFVGTELNFTRTVAPKNLKSTVVSVRLHHISISQLSHNTHWDVLLINRNHWQFGIFFSNNSNEFVVIICKMFIQKNICPILIGGIIFDMLNISNLNPSIILYLSPIFFPDLSVDVAWLKIFKIGTYKMIEFKIWSL